MKNFIIPFVILTLLILVFSKLTERPALSQYSVPIYTEPGGERMVVESGGTIEMATGTLKLEGMTVNIHHYAGDPGSATLTIATTGTDDSDLVIATLNSGAGVNVFSAVPQINSVSIGLSADPGRSIKLTLLTFED